MHSPATPFQRTNAIAHEESSGIVVRPRVREGTADLVEAVVAGRRGADRELVDRFKHHVVRLLTRTLGPGPDIEDRVQEVFFRVFRRLHKVRPPEALPGYVTSITVHVARETIRKRRRGRWLSFFSNDDLAAMSRGADDVPDEVRAFYHALAKLPEHGQLCITLRYVEGLELAEVAQALDVSLATVKRHLHRAEQELLGILGPWREGPAR